MKNPIQNPPAVRTEDFIDVGPRLRNGDRRSWWLRGFEKAAALAMLGLMGMGANAAPGVPAVTTASLLEEMTDLAGMASFPDPAFTCKQFSSYDRKSKSPEVDWFANADAGHYLRVEERGGRKEHVLMDAAGPGAVVRIWSANPAGRLRIYLDGAEKPVLEAPMTELLGGGFPGLPRPLAGERSKGWNLYFPIPYARHCKITSDEGGFYYHVNYRTYEAGTRVETFRLEQIGELEREIRKVIARLENPELATEELAGQMESFWLELPPGESVFESFSGPAAFARAVVRVSGIDLDAASRGVLVKIRFDGEACVEAPLGDLFGSGPGINPYRSLPLGMSAGGEMYCHWLMPFRDSAIIELVNQTRDPITLSGELTLRDHEWSEASMHFRAKWRAEFGVPTRPMIDWNYLTAQGRGVFAGAAFTIDNPVKDWWGEGDEKIYVDGETFPSHFGTGTEDYFGYAWCWPGLFTHAYHAQPRCDGPGNYGRTSVNRFHILDRIPFTRDFRFDMELWHWHARCEVNMAVTAYWYAWPGGRDGFKAIQATDLVVRPIAPYTAPRVKGAIEGESMKILRVTGVAAPQDWGNLSNDQHLWWHAGMKPGDQLVLAFPAPRAGRYEVIGRFLRARDYGIHQLAVNETDTGAPIDFYHPEVAPSEEVKLGVFDLNEGENVMTVTVSGANEKAVRSYMFGLDYLLLDPVP